MLKLQHVHLRLVTQLPGLSATMDHLALQRPTHACVLSAFACR
jgi:hypothetical protein